MLFVWNKFVCFICLRFRCYLGCVCLFGKYGDCALVELSLVEVNHAVSECIERVVLALTYVFTRIVAVAALANDDVARDDLLTTTNLNT